MAKKELKNKKSSSQKEEMSEMSNVCEVEAAKEPHKLGSVLRQIVDQIDDAERSNTDTLQEMQARLSSLSEQTNEAKSVNENVDSEALDKIETQIAGLSDRIEIISQGRAINADNLEGRIEALASKVSSDDRPEVNPPVSEDHASNATAPETEAVVSSKLNPESEAGAQKHVQQSRESLVDDADITFAVTDQLEQDGDFDPSELEAQQAFLDATHQSSDDVSGLDHPAVSSQTDDASRELPPSAKPRLSDYGVEHKIQASSYDNSSQIAPQRLASLAEHFSPVTKTGSKEETAQSGSSQQEGTPANSEVELQQALEEKDKDEIKGLVQELKQSEPSETEAVEIKHSSVAVSKTEENLESRFALIASRLEKTLAHNNRDLQEREEISTRFDELALKFESWLSSNDQKSSFNSIEQRIDALTTYVHKAEANAARIEAMEGQLIKLIDLVENNKPGTMLQNDLNDAFDDVASRILEEKSIQIADIIASKVGKNFDTRISDERLSEIQHSISAINAERRITTGDDSRNINAVNEALQTMSGRLSNIEEQIKLERAYSNQDLKKNTEFEVEENTDQIGEENDSFHDELELSVHEVIEDRSDEQFVQQPEHTDSFNHPNDLRHQNDFLPPPLVAQEPLFEASANQQNFSSSAEFENNHNDDYVAAAKRASQAAFERNQTELSEHPGIDIENEGVLDRIREQKNRLVEKGTDLRKRILSFRSPSSTSVFVIGAIGLMLICIGILFKELSSSGTSKPEFLARTTGDRLIEKKLSVPSITASRQGQERYSNQYIKTGVANQEQVSRYKDSGKNEALSSFTPEARNRSQNYQRIGEGAVLSNERVPSEKAPDKRQNISGSDITNHGAKRSGVRIKEETLPDSKNNVIGVSASEEKGQAAAGRREETVAGLTVITDNSQKMQLYRVGQTPGGPSMKRYSLGSLPVQGDTQVESSAKTASTNASRPQYIKQLSPKLVNGNRQASLPPEQIGSMALRTAAASGNFKAQFSVAMRYLRGEKVQLNYAAAVRWLTRSASQSFAPAQYNLGILFEKGLGVQKDIAKARTWYLRAANRGNVDAMHSLAVLYAQPSIVKPNYNEAILWFKQAANYGHTGSQYNLGVLYSSGVGVQKDDAQAYKWFTLSFARGVRNAAEQLGQLKSRMTKDQIFLAEADVARWIKRTPNKSANLTDKEVLLYTGSIMPPFGNSRIYDAQRMLNKLGYDVGPIDGQIGPKTRDAVKSFQLLNGLEATGVVTDRLIAVLNTQAS